MITTRIAFIVIVDDYHEIEGIARAIQGVDLSYRELGTTDTLYGPKYVGVIFNDNSPGDGEIQDLLITAKVEVDVN